MPLTSASWYAKSNPLPGDNNPGGGISTGTQTVPGAVSADANMFMGMDIASGMKGTPAGHPVTFWFALIGLFIAVKFLAESSGEGAEFHTIRISIVNILIVTGMAIIGLALVKWVLGFYRIPGITDLVLAV